MQVKDSDPFSYKCVDAKIEDFGEDSIATPTAKFAGIKPRKIEMTRRSIIAGLSQNVDHGAAERETSTNESDLIGNLLMTFVGFSVF